MNSQVKKKQVRLEQILHQRCMDDKEANKSWSTSSVIRKLQIKMRYTTQLLECTKSKSLTTLYVGEDAEWNSHFGRKFGSLFYNKHF